MAQLLKMDPEIRAIASSGYSNNPVMTNFKDYGFKAMLTKTLHHGAGYESGRGGPGKLKVGHRIGTLFF